MKACSYLLAAAALILLANCTAPQHPTRATQQRPRPTGSGYSDPDLVMLAQHTENRRSGMNIGFYSGWRQ